MNMSNPCQEKLQKEMLKGFLNLIPRVLSYPSLWSEREPGNEVEVSFVRPTRGVRPCGTSFAQKCVLI